MTFHQWGDPWDGCEGNCSEVEGIEKPFRSMVPISYSLSDGVNIFHDLQ